MKALVKIIAGALLIAGGASISALGSHQAPPTSAETARTTKALIAESTPLYMACETTGDSAVCQRTVGYDIALSKKNICRAGGEFVPCDAPRKSDIVGIERCGYTESGSCRTAPADDICAGAPCNASVDDDS